MLEQKTLNALRWIIGIINKKNVPYQISGGFAAKLYGSKRAVNDIDIDLPENRFADILTEVKPYIVSGPAHYQDGKWDLQLMTLNFNGQEIDISGALETKISNKKRTEWIAIPADLSNTIKMNVGDLVVNLTPPERMISYKQHLDGDHQTEDIKAMKKYIAKLSQ